MFENEIDPEMLVLKPPQVILFLSCTLKHLKSQFLAEIETYSVYIHACLLEVFFVIAFVGILAFFVLYCRLGKPSFLCI